MTLREMNITVLSSEARYYTYSGASVRNRTCAEPFGQRSPPALTTFSLQTG